MDLPRFFIAAYCPNGMGCEATLRVYNNTEQFLFYSPYILNEGSGKKVYIFRNITTIKPGSCLVVAKQQLLPGDSLAVRFTPGLEFKTKVRYFPE